MNSHLLEVKAFELPMEDQRTKLVTEHQQSWAAGNLRPAGRVARWRSAGSLGLMSAPGGEI
jgi:hypothetical protein